VIEIVQGGCDVFDIRDGLHGLCFLNGPGVDRNGYTGQGAHNGYDDQKLKEGEPLGSLFSFPSDFEATAV
jgi:hypothetical protein